MISAADFEAVLGVPARPVFWNRGFGARRPEARPSLEITSAAVRDLVQPPAGEPALDSVTPSMNDGEWAAG